MRGIVVAASSGTHDEILQIRTSRCVKIPESVMRYYLIRCRFVTAHLPLYFVGSQIRGALGYALKRTVCVNPSLECRGCVAAPGCLYFDWYEKHGGYHTFRLDIELGKPYYDVGIYLFGEATAKLPFVVGAIDRMLRVHGLGTERVKVNDFELYINGVSVRQGEGYRFDDVDTKRLDPPLLSPPKHLTLRLQTPLRIKYRNRLVRSIDALSLYSLVNSVHMRWNALQGNAKERLPFRAEGETVRRFGTFCDLSRYSSRQQGTLKIGGMVGEMRIENIDAQSYRLLRIGEIIGVGKQTVFGLGKIHIVPSCEHNMHSVEVL